MSIFQMIAEKKIKEAMNEGKFEDLPGKGQPLDFDDFSRVPEDLRLAYKILKNANYTPPEITLKKEIHKMEDMLGSISDEGEKIKQINKLNFMVLKFNMLRKQHVDLEEHQHYYTKIVDKLGKSPIK